MMKGCNAMNTIEASTGNVYADLGYADAPAMLVKAQLAQRISAIIARRKLTQREAADIVGIAQPKLSTILRGQFRGVSEAKLLDALRHLGQDVQIVVKPARRKTEMGNLSVAFA
jgi:predicted XRE-type DNA-binding protein